MYDSLVPTDANGRIARHSANVNGVPTRRRMVSSRIASDYIGASDRLMWSGHKSAKCTRNVASSGLAWWQEYKYFALTLLHPSVLPWSNGFGGVSDVWFSEQATHTRDTLLHTHQHASHFIKFSPCVRTHPHATHRDGEGPWRMPTPIQLIDKTQKREKSGISTIRSSKMKHLE